MLAADELPRLCERLGLSAEARSVIEGIRSSPPARRVRSAAGNVSARYASRKVVECPPELDSDCRLLVADNVVSADVVRRNSQVAEAALRPWIRVFNHGDLQIVHLLDDGDEASGVGDWSEGGQGDATYHLATLTLAREEHLYDVMAGYGGHIETRGRHRMRAGRRTR